VIPHSLAATTLYRARVGQEVNVECDMLAKYVEKMLHPPSVEKESVDATEALNMDFLAENGYL
ncbi:MAG: riboflavin synthase, partial [Clostridia bacterium]|nr:riboflavin synthase [Clostridia bacterium]